MVELVCKNNSKCLEEIFAENNEAFKYLPLCQNLKKFVVSDVTRMTLQYLSELKSLVTLKFNSGLVNADALDCFFKQAHLNNLEILEMRKFDLDDRILKSIASK